MGNDSIIYIRTDGNDRLATGHFVRCLCIAGSLKELGKEICFIVSDRDSGNLLKELYYSLFLPSSFPYSLICLKTAVYNNPEQELSELTGLLRGRPVLLVDSYFVTPSYLSALKALCPIAYIDDIRAFDYPVDLLINYDVIPPGKLEQYEKSYLNSGSTLLGTAYAPLRPQFQNNSVKLRGKIKDILISCGGSDPFSFSERILSYLLSHGINADFHIVVGKLFSDTTMLDLLAQQYPQVHLHHNVSNMADLMIKCDYAISAAGTTLYELCALGLPSISFTMADNQLTMAHTFAEIKAIPYGGDIRKQEDRVLVSIIEHLRQLLSSPQKQQEQQLNMGALIDGKGARRIALALCEL